MNLIKNTLSILGPCEQLYLESISEASMEISTPSAASTLREEDQENHSTCSSASSTRSGPSFLPQIDPKGQLSTQKLNNNFVPNGIEPLRSFTPQSPVMSSRYPTLSASASRSSTLSEGSLAGRPPGVFIDNLHSEENISYPSGRPHSGSSRSGRTK